MFFFARRETKRRQFRTAMRTGGDAVQQPALPCSPFYSPFPLLRRDRTRPARRAGHAEGRSAGPRCLWRCAMSFRSWFSRKSSRTVPPSRPRRVRPCLEALEDRLVLSTVEWSGAVSSNWSNAANWHGGVAPVAGDNLVFG